jgi:hypothetical protein
MSAQKQERSRGISTTFEIIRNYREFLQGRISRAEYGLRSARVLVVSLPGDEDKDPVSGTTNVVSLPLSTKF